MCGRLYSAFFRAILSKCFLVLLCFNLLLLFTSQSQASQWILCESRAACVSFLHNIFSLICCNVQFAIDSVLFFLFFTGISIINSVLFFVLCNGSFIINIVLFSVIFNPYFIFFAGNAGPIRIQIGTKLFVEVTFPDTSIQIWVANTRLNFDHGPVFPTAMLINNTVYFWRTSVSILWISFVFTVAPRKVLCWPYIRVLYIEIIAYDLV